MQYLFPDMRTGLPLQECVKLPDEIANEEQHKAKSKHQAPEPKPEQELEQFVTAEPELEQFVTAEPEMEQFVVAEQKAAPASAVDTGIFCPDCGLCSSYTSVAAK